MNSVKGNESLDLKQKLGNTLVVCFRRVSGASEGRCVPPFSVFVLSSQNPPPNVHMIFSPFWALKL
jgi:hypothetical protein